MRLALHICMTQKQIERVARFHANSPGCTPFDGAVFGTRTWLLHFESDLKYLSLRKKRRCSSPNEVQAITAFLEERMRQP